MKPQSITDTWLLSLKNLNRKAREGLAKKLKGAFYVRSSASPLRASVVSFASQVEFGILAAAEIRDAEPLALNG